MKLNIETSDGQAVVDAEGSEPYKDAQFALSRLLDEGGEIEPDELERVVVVLETDASDSSVVPVREHSRSEAQPSAAGERNSETTSDNSETDSIPASDGGVSAKHGSVGPNSVPTNQGTDTVENFSYLEDNDREIGRIREGGTHHVTLSLLAQTDASTTPEIRELYPQCADSTIPASLSILYKRKMANREEIPENDNGGRFFEYSISPHGRQVLDEFGTITPEEWAEQ